MSNKITKKNYADYTRSTNVHNTLSHQISDLQAHIQFLTRTGNVDALEALSSEMTSFLAEVTSSYINTLSDDE